MSYGSTAEAIGRITDPAQLQQMLKNPSYAGFTGVIIARISEINRMRQAAQAQQPTPPTVAQQALSGQAPPQQQAMAAGGIVAFKHGGKVRKYDTGGKVDKVPAFWDTVLGDWAHPVDTIGKRYIANYDYKPKTGKATPAPQAVAPVPEPMTQPQETATPPKPLGPPINPKDYGVDPMVGGAGGIRAGLRSPDYSRVKSFEDYLKEMQTGNEGDMKNLAEDRAAIKTGQAQNPHMAMIAAGLNMAHDASVNPHSGFMGNVAAGGLGGLNYYTQQGDQQAAQLRDLNKVSRQENQAMRAAAVQERGQDIRAASASAAQTAMAKAYANKGFLDEQDIRGYAAYLAKQDRASGQPVKDPAYYVMEAKQHANAISSGMQIAGVNNAAKAVTATQTGWNNYQKTNGPVPFERYQQMISSGQPDAAQAESGGTILGTYPGVQ
jgi:hypothetical protein